LLFLSLSLSRFHAFSFSLFLSSLPRTHKHTTHTHKSPRIFRQSIVTYVALNCVNSEMYILMTPCLVDGSCNLNICHVF
jgi:hypothetical protein